MNVSETLSEVKNFIDGKFERNGQNAMDVLSPIDGSKISTLPLSSGLDVDSAVQAAKKAFPAWAAMTLKERVQIFFRYRALLEKHMEELTNLVHIENGKTYGEAKAEVEKSMELCEFAVSMPQIIVNEVQEVSKGVECRIERKPLGVVASITPFNFPNMVPHWTMPNALVLGNTMVMKPSEIVPLSTVRMAELLKEAGLPDGVFNIVNGGKDVVEAICDHKDIEAVSFVGSTKVAKIVYQRATSNLKRCVALGGAKNHLLVLPDANPEMTASNVVASMSGCAGQRCMAASVMVGVDKVQHIIDRMVDETKKLVPGDNLGSVISAEAKKRIEGYIAEAEANGAKILVDGRNTTVPGKEGGFYVGPTIIDYVTTDMSVAREEIFGPVISIIRAKDLDEAIAIENGSDYGNAAAVFTQSGGLAKEVIDRASAGMIGVNIGVPVPREPFSFGGWNESKFGVGDITGRSSIEFWTQNKKTTIKWNPEARTNWMS
ncbi:MAG: CoA-acylating methylmalonate-semialdehyde dehydrogenase [Bacteroidia bacterium]|nr:CoA-acylating methylmalonate-semialdehyde dehydrogenase [Bacteroidia bacterium]NND26648.1 CoA-acylating methylmalonate-semialdehyde dehydrogenase [Flavobacteriaceae bacterium]MBT8279893.1 CoA-acylating methylmalonate-semialdehyde dehydrogenase [Bacteroidia bacterium]NNK60707.1 CoA-acylating methylmalonate-semialdehyde dehydrogenase [Flavobacteriaceae bacterium]NNL33905.1 CoA-acylating methylmalonate-semialdehyde dehydrogenase [Flavobacteriaceae bacterium]